jgi:hypothetical protein
MANTLKLFRNGAVGFIDWLDVTISVTRVNAKGGTRIELPVRR